MTTATLPITWRFACLIVGLTLSSTACRTPAPSAEAPSSNTPPERTSAAGSDLEKTGAQPATLESKLKELALAGPVTNPDSEISGMAWFGQHLILLPQYPRMVQDEGDGALLAIPRAELEEAIAADAPSPITPRLIPLKAPGLRDGVPGFQGYEAIHFDGTRLFVTIEAEPETDLMVGYLLEGEIADDLSGVAFNPTGRQTLAAQSSAGNMCYEAMTRAGDTLLTFYEANSARINERPRVLRFDDSLQPMKDAPMAPIEYRVTDATTVDDAGRFWVINYYWPGNEALKAPDEPLAARFGKGLTHASNPQVERLVELQIDAESGAVAFTDTPPVQLELTPDNANNWEGLVRMGERGFLVITDKFPGTRLIYVER